MPALLRYQLDASLRSIWTIPAVLAIAAVLACISTPNHHALLLNAITWTSLCLGCTVKTGARSLLEDRPGRATAHFAGLLLAIGQLCERAAGPQNLWWAQALLAIVLFVLYQYGIISNDEEPNEKDRKLRFSTSRFGLGILTLCALIASYKPTGSKLIVALGLAYLVLQVLVILGVERALKEASSRQNGSVIYSTAGLLTQPVQAVERPDVLVVVLRDMSAVAAIVCFVTAIAWESWRFDGLTQFDRIGRVLGDSWIPGQSILSIVQAAIAVVIQIVFIIALVSMVHKEKPQTTSLVLLVAFTSAFVFTNFSFNRLWFLCLSAAYLTLYYETGDGSPPSRTLSRVLGLVTLVSILFVPLDQLRQGGASQPHASTLHFVLQGPHEPVQLADAAIHPIAQLTRDAQAAWAAKVSRQSKTLDAAVIEYKRRYGISPPPNFDRWFEYAKTRDVQLIDEHDTIYNSLLPFWALSPATIRARARDALGAKDNNLVGLLIRDGKAVHVEKGDDWQQRATVGLLEHFVQYLPDMDLAFNIHDEPRVVLPAAGLERLVSEGRAELSAASSSPSNTFSGKPSDLNNGRRIEESRSTVFNLFAHQHTWGPSKISCPPDTAVGSMQMNPDNLTSYALGELGFIYNQTAFTDICNSPTLEMTHGFFQRANAFNVVYDLFPIFSQSKMSSFQDILYPSPWYWYDKVSYEQNGDLAWEKKGNKLWWRGSTTGGFSRDGGWRYQHRQGLVRTLNAKDKAKILTRDLKPTEVDRQDDKELIDVQFSSIGQCDEGDCAAQREFFTIANRTEQQEAWKYKYLFDIDGNAFSGRFYAFLRSKSLTFKMAVFREWHTEWIAPWVHYIPISLRGEELLEAVRYIDAEKEGQAIGASMAAASSVWAKGALRKEDYEAWFFRLLLEYGRLVDDNRANIGYSM